MSVKLPGEVDHVTVALTAVSLSGSLMDKPTLTLVRSDCTQSPLGQARGSSRLENLQLSSICLREEQDCIRVHTHRKRCSDAAVEDAAEDHVMKTPTWSVHEAQSCRK